MSGGPVGVGIIGAGMISNTYLEHLCGYPDTEVLIIGDLDAGRAAERAASHCVAASGTAEDVLAHEGVEIVVNLTIPAVHAQVSSAALGAGKHVWSEKPIAVDRASARALLAQADAAGLRLGVAPDTVLGPGLQTARRAIATGAIGVPLSAATSMAYVGPDLFHPSPEFLFAAGGGPVLDMGPYYVTALVAMLGPVDWVAAVGAQARARRTILVGDRAGTEFPVEVPTHVAAIMQFEDGPVGQSTFSFDSHLRRTGIVEVTGTDGTLVVPDPNTFGGEVRIARRPGPGSREPEWETLAPVGVESGRGLGVLDMARAIRGGVPHIATGELGYHVLDTLTAIGEAIVSGNRVDVESTVGEIPLVPDDRDPMAATCDASRG